MKPEPRALYIEIKRRYTGSNNGQIFLSHREAAKSLNVNRNTVGNWFKELQRRGLIRQTRGPHLGPSGIGQASLWALEELPTSDGKPATKSFVNWKDNLKPPPKKQDSTPPKTGQPKRNSPKIRQGVLKNGTVTVTEQFSAS